MPAKITIPEAAVPDLERIAALDDGCFDTLIRALRETKPTLTPTQLEQRLGGKVSLPNKLDLRAILTPAFVLFSMMEKTGASAGEIAEAVMLSPALEASENLPAAAREKLRARLEQLLTLEDTLGATAKALDVMTEHERIFCTARILSDIRPVFSGIGERASAAVIIHNLQLGFHRDGKHTEIYIALDTDDLKTLKDVVNRAQEKTVAMESLLKAAEVPYLEV